MCGNTSCTTSSEQGDNVVLQLVSIMLCIHTRTQLLYVVAIYTNSLLVSGRLMVAFFRSPRATSFNKFIRSNPLTDWVAWVSIHCHKNYYKNSKLIYLFQTKINNSNEWLNCGLRQTINYSDIDSQHHALYLSECAANVSSWLHQKSSPKNAHSLDVSDFIWWQLQNCLQTLFR